ncbi:MAG: hypothetical protein H0V62_03660 [Gammaproteobacteria bacterium]|nr:hypothetical protein [Gammaproteobacteria bacterium]
MPFLQAALHLLQTDPESAVQPQNYIPAHRASDSCIAFRPHREQAITALLLILGAPLAPAYAQQFNFTATPGLNQTQATMAAAMDNACNTLQATPGTNRFIRDLQCPGRRQWPHS